MIGQSAELATARRGGYTVTELVDFAGATYQEIDGEAEAWLERLSDFDPRRVLFAHDCSV